MTTIKDQEREAAQLQTLLTDRFADVRPAYPAGLYAWAHAALSRQPVPSRELPPLPDPIGEIVGTQFNGSEFFGCFQNEYKPVEKLRIYTADQMREYAALCAQPSLEVVAWGVWGATGKLYDVAHSEYGAQYAAGITKGTYAPLCRCDAPAPHPNQKGFAVDVLGNPMREFAPGKWENASWPSDAPAPSNPNAHVAVQLGESAAASVTVELTEAESEVLDDFAKRQDLSRPAVMRQALRAYQMESVAIPFWQKHALGSLARLSCFKCGGNEHEAAIKHMELPNIYVCTACVERSAAIPAPISDEFIDAVILSICEMEDRFSPDDFPEAMVVTPKELRSFIRKHEELFAENAALDASPTAQTQQSSGTPTLEVLGAGMLRWLEDRPAPGTILYAAAPQTQGLVHVDEKHDSVHLAEPAELADTSLEPCSQPFERVPQHAYDPGHGPVPPIPKVVQLHGRNDACCGKPEDCEKNCYLRTAK